MADPAPELIAQGFLRGLRLATVGVSCAVIFGLDLVMVVRYAGTYRPSWFEIVTWAGVAAVVFTSTCLAVRGRPWGRLRWPFVAVVVACSVASTWSVAPEDLVGPPHWAFDSFGWCMVPLLLDLPLGWFASVLAGFLATTAVQVAMAGRADAGTLVGMATATLVVGGWETAVVLSATALRRTAVVAGRTAQREEQLRTAELVSEQLHRDRRSRYTDLATSAAPLLTGIGTGELDPGDPAVQRACTIAAARMRRLFAESDQVREPLEHELRACIDIAERRGVAVQFAVRGTPPPVPKAVRRALTEPAIVVLAAATTTARITIVSVAGTVAVSAVTACAGAACAGAACAVAAAEGVTTDLSQDTTGSHAVGSRIDPVVRVTSLEHAGQLWLEATWSAR